MTKLPDKAQTLKLLLLQSPGRSDLVPAHMERIQRYLEALEWVSEPLPPWTDRTMSLLHTFITLSALSWLFYRAWQIFQKPNAELIDILGLDIPVVPEVSLGDIQPTSIRLLWKPPETYNTVLKYYIQVNGINVGESPRSVNSVTVKGLRPGHLYNVRVIATNASNFQAQGALIRLRTAPECDEPVTPMSSHGSHGAPTNGTAVGETPGTSTGPHVEPASLAITTPAMARELSGGHNHLKRLGNVRRNSPASAGADQTNPVPSRGGDGNDSDDPQDAEQTVRQLTETLEALRQENEQVERQIGEEDAEYEASRASFMKERDHLKHALKEREEASSELRKQVAQLDRANRAAQSKKAAKEKVLQQKEGERRKMKHDALRWDKDIADMGRDIQEMEKEKSEIAEAKEQKTIDIRRDIRDCQDSMKLMEEEIRVKGVHIKELEEERKKIGGGEDVEESWDSTRVEREHDLQWDMKLRGLQGRYTTLWNTLQQAETNLREAQEQLAWWNTRRAASSSQFTSIASADPTSYSKVNKHRRAHQSNSRASTISSPAGGFPIGSSAFGSISSISPTFPSGSAFFNVTNGMTIPPTSEHNAMSQKDVDTLTGGAPMSPTANSLLPSNLLDNDETISPRFTDLVGDMHYRGGISNGLFAGVGAPGLPNLDNAGRGPHSPVSSSSRSPSLFSSPRESLNNIHAFQPGSDGRLDSDRRSVNSSGASFGAIGSGPTDNTLLSSARLSNLFNFNRQRGKTSANEPPPLGSLKPGQSQSFPRNLDQGDLDPIGTRPRRGSHSGRWVSPMSNLLNRGSGVSNDISGSQSSALARNAASRRRGFNLFSSKYDPLDPSKLGVDPSSRRSSTYSFENSLPRPSTDSQPFGWPVTDTFGHGHRSSPLGTDWSVPGTWSRSQSRRQSGHYGSTSNLSLGTTPLDPDTFQSALNNQVSPPAPIGTRPQSSQRPPTPKLNPAAPSFKTLFSRSDAKKAEKAASKAAEKEKSKNKESEKSRDMDKASSQEEASPPDERLSRDSRSIATSSSVADSHDALDRSTSGTPSDAATPSAGKETLMQKITRKSSSSMFNIPWNKDKGGLFSRKAGDSGTPGEIDEDAPGGVDLGKSYDSTASTSQSDRANRSSISWSILLKKSRKNDKAASEASERASETGEDEDD